MSFQISAMQLTNFAADEELHLRRTSTVADTDSASERNEVSRAHVVLGDEGLLDVDDLIETNVGVERGLDGVEQHDRAVSASTARRVGQIFCEFGRKVIFAYPNLPWASMAGEMAIPSWKTLLLISDQYRCASF